MSGAQRRPQPFAELGLRVLLIAERRMANPHLQAALAEIERIGWIFVSIVEPGRYLDAVRMLSSGLIDRVVVLRPEDFPVISAGDLATYASQTSAGAARTRMLPRLSSEQVRLRRPQPVERPAEVAPPTGDVPDPHTQLTDRDPATRLPRRTASERHHQGAAGGRRRRV
jgi:hypothetical protein